MWLRRFEVRSNVGNEETVSVRSGGRNCFPDLVLTTKVGGRRVHAVVEVETSESVNHLEAMSEWRHFAKVRGSFYLYVPAGFTELALRLCQASEVNVTEIWAYYAIDSKAKFSMSYRSPRREKQLKMLRVRLEKNPQLARKSTPRTKELKGTKSSLKSPGTRSDAKKLAVTKKKLAVTKKKPAVTKKKPVVTKKKPAVTKKKLAVTKKKPAVTKKKLAVTKKKPAVTKKKPAVTKKKLAVTKKKPAVTKKKLAVTKKKPA
jgi:hypothetical protein